MCVLYARVCARAHVCMCGACICWRWNLGLQTTNWATHTHSPASFPFLIPAPLIPCLELGTGLWNHQDLWWSSTLYNAYFTLLLHCQKGLEARMQGDRWVPRHFHWRLHVWGAYSAQGQCPLWLLPICDFALGTSGVRALPSHREDQGHAAPMGIWIHDKRMPANPYPRGRHPCGSPHRNRRLAQCKWYHVPHTETQPATWELGFIFV